MKDLERGQVAESAIQDYLSELFRKKKAQLEVKDETMNREKWKEGIDFKVIDTVNDREVNIEVKTSFYDSDKIFLETESVFDGYKKDGWLYSSKADLIYYFIEKRDLMLVINFKELRENMPLIEGLSSEVSGGKNEKYKPVKNRGEDSFFKDHRPK